MGCASGESTSSTEVVNSTTSVTTQSEDVSVTGPLLPVVTGPGSSSDDIHSLQQLLALYCCDLEPNGGWNEATASGIAQFRSFLGLPEGGLDDTLWNAVFEIDPPSEYLPIASRFFEIQIPHNVVLVDPLSVALPSTARYVVASRTRLGDLEAWYRWTTRNRDLPTRSWCKEVGSPSGSFEYWWWIPSNEISGTVLSLRVVEVKPGRVEIMISERGADRSGCATPSPNGSTTTEGTGLLPDGEDGWRKVSAHFSVKPLDFSAPGWECGSGATCVNYLIAADLDCPAGGYVEAMVRDAGGVIVDLDNDLIPSLEAGDVYKWVATAYSDSAHSFKIESIYCF